MSKRGELEGIRLGWEGSWLLDIVDCELGSAQERSSQKNGEGISGSFMLLVPCDYRDWYVGSLSKALEFAYCPQPSFTILNSEFGSPQSLIRLNFNAFNM